MGASPTRLMGISPVGEITCSLQALALPSRREVSGQADTSVKFVSFLS